MKKIDALRDLQAIDTSLDQVRGELGECRSKLGDDSLFVPLRQELDSIRSSLQTMQSKAKELDAEVEKRSSKLRADEKKLYGGTVKNPKELTDLSKEVEQDKAQLSKIEDQALAIMDSLESSTAAESAASTALAGAEKAWKEEQSSLESRCSVLGGREAELSAQRAQTVAALDAATLRSYEMVRRMRGGLAVVPVERGTCQGCRISLSSSVIQRARAGADLVPCQNCGRFLYVP